MRALSIVLFLLLAAVVGFAQLNSYTVTVKASQPLSVQPDQVLIGVDVETGLTSGLGDFIGALSSVGITASNLNGVSTVYGAGSQQQNAINWSFSLAVPWANLGSTLNGLAKLSQTMNLSFSIAGLQVSPQAQASQQCPTAALMADAKAQAVALAQAAGFALGSLLAISDGNQGGQATTPAIIFDAVSGFLSAAPPALVCSVVATFGLAPAV